MEIPENKDLPIRRKISKLTALISQQKDNSDFFQVNVYYSKDNWISCQCINLILCTFLIYNTRPNVILIYSTYLLSLIIFYMTYTIIYLNTMSLDNYWQIYLIAMGINGIICIPLAIIDKLIKLGI